MGNTLIVLTRDGRRVTKEHFLATVQRQDNGCWFWPTKPSPDNGYARITSAGKRYWGHRFAYELWADPIPKGLTIDHLCRTRRCVNPAHLEVVTIEENNLRGFSPPAINRRKTHCPRGHAYSAKNTYYLTDTKRYCRECLRIFNRAASRRRTREKTQCAKGHALSGENVLFDRNGRRSCRTCVRDGRARRELGRMADEVQAAKAGT